MTVTVAVCLFLVTFLPYNAFGGTNVCPPDTTCVPISECELDADNGEVLYPCKHSKYICCARLKSQTHKYEPFNLINSGNNNSEYSENLNNFQHSTTNHIITDSNNYSNVGSTNANQNPTQHVNRDKFNNIHDKKDSNIRKRPAFTNDVDVKRNHTWTSDTDDPIRFNIPDFHRNRTVNNNSANSGHKVSGSIVKRREPFKRNCGLSLVDNKITGGQVAEPGQFPWMALLGFKQHGTYSNQFLCGGSLIASKYVLTAAHCIVENRPLELVMVRFGEYNLSTTRDCVQFGKDRHCIDQHVDIGVDRVFVHPEYNRTTLKNDIALIRVRQDVRESDYIKTICLPFELDLTQVNLTGQNFTVSGWGKLKSGNLFGSDALQFAKVKAWDSHKCNNSIPSEVRPLSPTQLCANGPNNEDSCKGDSGGPLISTYRDTDKEIRQMQYGIVSFGTATCGDKNLPTIYTRVDKYLQWILENVT